MGKGKDRSAGKQQDVFYFVAYIQFCICKIIVHFTYNKICNKGIKFLIDTTGSPKRTAVESPKSPKGKGGASSSATSFKREQLKRDIPPINVTPYPLSTSTEMAMAMSSEAQALQVT